MPKPSDYSKGLIYKLCCKDTNIKDIYVGSTCNFTRRKYGHKGASNNENHKCYNNPIYKFIREKGGWLNWNMVLVKYFPCKSRLELLQEEQIVIEELGEYTTLNRARTWRSKEYVREYEKNWRTENKEYVKEYGKNWRKENKDALAEHFKKWKQDNKEKYEKTQKKPYTCITCNKTIQNGSKKRHNHSKTHIQKLQKSD